MKYVKADNEKNLHVKLADGKAEGYYIRPGLEVLLWAETYGGDMTVHM